MLTLRNQTFSLHVSESIFHVIIWSFVIFERWLNHYAYVDNSFIYGLYQTIFLVLTFILPVYLNALVLIPAYLKKSKWLLYTALLLTLIFSVNVTRGLLATLYFQLLREEFNFLTTFFEWAFTDYASFDRFIFSPTAWILWLSFFYRFVKDWLVHEQIQTKLKADKVALELAFLKSQVNPHFLFNTLNNLYALALEEKAPRTADGVATMGTLMRYSLHDSQTDRILLSKEIDYLERYIELQKLRMVETMGITVAINFQVDELKNEKIAPMILLPFIENAFKYGISTIRPSSIEIELKLVGSILTLEVRNPIHEIINESQGGIGLRNVRNRLQLLYPNRHKLACTKNNNVYCVSLEINISE